MPVIFILLLALTKYLEPQLLNILFSDFPDLTHADQFDMRTFISDANSQMEPVIS